MSTPAGAVAVDIGNTAVKVAFGTGQEMAARSIALDVPGWEIDVIRWVRDQCPLENPQWRIASVRRSAFDQLVAALGHRESTDPPITRVSRHDVPMAMDVDHPEQIGIDRLLGAFAVANRVNNAAVVIDAGTAVTVDWVCSRGRFGGGAILPGLGMQSKALAGGTDALPGIDWHGDRDAQICLPAKNTTDAIRNGILIGIAAGIDALIRRYRQAAGLSQAAVGVVLTGGDGAAISPHLTHHHTQMPNLVCRGLLDLPRS